MLNKFLSDVALVKRERFVIRQGQTGKTEFMLYVSGITGLNIEN